MIDLRSDTVTTPDTSMRDAMASADVGDDVYGEDPTVNRLEEQVSDILDTEAALFCPSGTMANQIAIDVWTDPGEELLLESHSHIYRYEVGGAARHAGLQTRPLDGRPRGILGAEAVSEAIQMEALHVAGTGLLSLENTHNSLGGRALSVDDIAAPASVAREHDIPVHLDGARLWNAAVACDVAVADFVTAVDSVMVSLSKGLGAPVGSMLAGSSDFIEQARRSRKAFGGGMRQAGVIAAAGLTALEYRDNLDREHRLAQQLADGLEPLEGVEVIYPESNIVIADLDPTLSDADTWLSTGSELGVAGTDMGPQTIRYVTHRDVSQVDVTSAVELIEELHETVSKH